MKKILSRIDFSYIYSFLGEATLGLTFVLYILLGKVLGPERYGIFATADALAGILTFFIGFGLADLSSRDIAANPQEGTKSTTTFLLIEAVNCLVVLLVLLPIAKVFGFEGSGIVVCYLAVFAGGCRSAKQTLRSIFRGLGQFRGETIAVTIERLALFGIAGAVLFATDSLVWVVGVMAVVRLLDAIGLYAYLNSKVSLTEPITLSSVQNSFKMAYPFAISGVLWVLYYQIDILMLKAILSSTDPKLAAIGSAEVGYYGSAYKLIEIFSALPRVIFYVSFTKLAQCYATDPSQMPVKIKQTALLLLAIVLPLVTIAGFCQPLLIDVTYGKQFLPAMLPLSILLPSLSIKMFASLSLNIFQAIRREKLLPIILLITVCINVLANAILIPRYGAAGAASATLLSELIFSVTGLILIARVGYRCIGQTLLAVALMSLLVSSIPSFMRYGLNPIISIALMAAALTIIGLLMRRSPDNP